MLIIAQILSRFMKKANEEFVTACNGIEALEKYRNAPESFKLVFMGTLPPCRDDSLYR